MTDEIEAEEVEWQYVVAMDPGGTTGLAALRYTDDTQPELIYLHQIEDGQQGFLDWFEGSEVTDNVTLVSENFTIREGVHGADVTPLRIEGIQYALWRDEIVYQEPKMKSLIKDSWLKEQNLWTPGKRHQMDALIHALVYLRNEGHQPTLESLSGRAEKTIEEEGGAESKQIQEQIQEQPQGVPDEDGEAGVESEDGEEAGEGEGDGAPADDEGEGAGADGEGGEGAGGEISAVYQEPEGKGQPGGDADAKATRGATEAEEAQGGDYYDVPDVEVRGERKRREVGGSFAGFESGDGGSERTLLDD